MGRKLKELVHGVYVIVRHGSPVVIGGKSTGPFSGASNVSGPDQKDPYGWLERGSGLYALGELYSEKPPMSARARHAVASIARSSRFCKVLRTISKPKFKSFVGRYSNLGGKPSHLHASIKEAENGDLFFSKLVSGSSVGEGGEMVTEGVVEGPSSLVLVIRKFPLKENSEDKKDVEKKYFTGSRHKLGGRSEFELKRMHRLNGAILPEDKGRFIFAWCNHFKASQHVAVIRGKGMAVSLVPPLVAAEEALPAVPTNRYGRQIRFPTLFEPPSSGTSVPAPAHKLTSICGRTNDNKYVVTVEMTEEEVLARNGASLIEKFNYLRL